MKLLILSHSSFDFSCETTPNLASKVLAIESDLGEGGRVTFCLKSLATQRGSVKTKSVNKKPGIFKVKNRI